MPSIDQGNYATLSAMITPALFMTANGSLIISTSNRMARIVDRIRALTLRYDEYGRGDAQLDFLEERQAHVSDQLGRLVRRSDLIRTALTMLYLSFASFVGTSLTLAVDTLVRDQPVIARVATALSVAGVGLMLVANINLIREAHVALSGNGREIAFYRDLQARREKKAAAAAGDQASSGRPISQ